MPFSLHPHCFLSLSKNILLKVFCCVSSSKAWCFGLCPKLRASFDTRVLLGFLWRMLIKLKACWKVDRNRIYKMITGISLPTTTRSLSSPSSSQRNPHHYHPATCHDATHFPLCCRHFLKCVSKAEFIYWVLLYIDYWHNSVKDMAELIGQFCQILHLTMSWLSVLFLQRRF